MNTHKTLKNKEIDVFVYKLLSCVGRVDLEKPFSPHVPAGGFTFFLRFLSKSNIFMT